jgi:hypothetical protein
VTAPPTNETAAEKVVRLEGELRAFDERRSSDAPAKEKPTLFEQDDKLTQEFAKAFEKAEAKSERADEGRINPGAKIEEAPRDSFTKAFEQTYDFLNSTKAEKAERLEAHRLVEQVKENAERFGVTLTDEQALSKAMDLERQQATNDFAPAVEHLKSAFRDSSPVESAKFFSGVKRDLDSDPVGTLSWIAGQYGLHPMALAQQVAARFGGQRGQRPTQEMLNALTHTVNQTAANLDRFDDHQEEILGIIQKGEIKRSGDHSADLRAAYNLAVKREAKLSPDARLTRQLSRAYDRAEARNKK